VCEMSYSRPVYERIAESERGYALYRFGQTHLNAKLGEHAVLFVPGR
jgi:hypothetical protein